MAVNGGPMTSGAHNQKPYEPFDKSSYFSKKHTLRNALLVLCLVCIIVGCALWFVSF